ncbi:unnamed protein product [Thlaspi arvense]|uniref:Uncharacterized protein n=1 Tax=Thlaspi arvense TaxID=13288 RepID=A0AAU9T8H9_THLAR|nr:unnamed protein product [Thlaspi arvense]
MYRQDSELNLSLMVADLLSPLGNWWNVGLIRQTFTDEDAERILQIKPNLHLQDTKIWGFAKNGCYDSRSGYKLLESLDEA